MVVNPDGTRSYSNTYNGVTTTTTVDADNRVLSVTKSNSGGSSSGSSGGSSSSSSKSSSGSSSSGSSVSSEPRRKTTYTFKDGQSYTGYETNWEDAARAAGNTSGLSRAISYPEYVNADEAYRYINEMGDRYGVVPGAPTTASGAYETAVSKEYAVNNGLIPDYDTPFNSYSTTGNSNTYGVPEYTGVTRNDIDNYLGAAADQYKNEIELLKQQQVKNYNAQRERVNRDVDDAQQEAYITSEVNRNKSIRNMREMGITGGLSESSIIKQNTNLENQRQQNEKLRQQSLADIDLNESNALANYDAKYMDYSANLQQTALSAYMQADAARNSYNQWAAEYMAARTDAERSYAYQQAQLALQKESAAESKLNSTLEYAIELRDYATLEKMGYDTSYLKALSDAEVRQANLSGYSSGGSGSSKSALSLNQAISLYKDGVRTDKVLDVIASNLGEDAYMDLDNEDNGVEVTNRSYKGTDGRTWYVVDGKGYSDAEIRRGLESGKFGFADSGLKNGSYIIKNK